MNERDRFHATMHYGQRDRCPIMDFSFWDETIELWHEQGLPVTMNRSHIDAYFGMDGLERHVVSRVSTATFAPSTARRAYVAVPGVNVGLCPLFEERVIEDRDEHEVIQQADGVRVLRKKFMSSIPMHQGHLLVDKASWEQHYAPRLAPDHRGRLSSDWDCWVVAWSKTDRANPLFLPGGSLFGWLRNWMGIEAVSYVVYDAPAWFEQMVNTIADCIVGVLKRVLASGVRFEACGMWEDMCFNAGPLLSPDHFRKFLVPQYRRITELLRAHGVDIVWVDCDGKIDDLIPLWLDAGVNCMMPVEIGTWGADPVAFRKRFGKELLMMGGFDKHVLAQSKEAIEREVQRLTPLVEEGGYIPFCDHRVPPDVPLANYVSYLKNARHVWGKDLNLRPMHEPG